MSLISKNPTTPGQRGAIVSNFDEITSKENKKSLIFVTHNNYFAEQANNIFKLSNATLEQIK